MIDTLTERAAEVTEQIRHEAVDGERERPLDERARNAITEGATNGSLALATGGALLLLGARSMARGRLRAIVQVVVGSLLVRSGLERRRGAATEESELGDERTSVGADESATDESTTDGPDESIDEPKETSDDAHAAGTQHSLGPEPGDDAEGAVGADATPDADDAGEAANDGTGDSVNDEVDESATTRAGASNVEFVDTDDGEPRSEPGLDTEDDPRHSGDEDRVEVDVSASSVADESGEATGPTPEQGEPTQTDDTEPDDSPEEDASHLRVDSPAEHGADGGDETSEAGGSEDETSEADESDGER